MHSNIYFIAKILKLQGLFLGISIGSTIYFTTKLHIYRLDYVVDSVVVLQDVGSFSALTITHTHAWTESLP